MSSKAKNIVITGANRGIGFQTMKQLYLQGNNIIFGCRTLQLNQQAIDKVKNQQLKENKSIHQELILKSYPLDLSKKQSIQKFVQNVNKQFSSVDILINNAGIINYKNQLIQQIQVQKALAVNYYGHFYLTFLLYQKLKKSSQARIINVSASSYQFVPRKFFDDLSCKIKLFDYNKQFIISKFMLVVFTLELAKRMQNKGVSNVKVFSLHPGLVDTTMEGQQCLANFYKKICGCCYKTPYQGARTSIYLAGQNFSNLKSGAFYDSDTSTKQIDFRASKQQIAAQLWKLSQQAYKISFNI